MPIRKIKHQDLNAVSTLCLMSFNQFVAPTLSAQGIATFKQIATVENIKLRMNEGHIVLVYEEKNVIRGMIELKDENHLAMLFIHPEYQKQGLGKILLDAIKLYVQSDILTVRASLNAVQFYEKYGFFKTGSVSEFSGLKYQSMALSI